jgi:hypothetical protein
VLAPWPRCWSATTPVQPSLKGDLLRERVAENIGNAGDSELMSLNAPAVIVVSVPADTKIYVVFTKHEESQTGLHRVAGQ